MLDFYKQDGKIIKKEDTFTCLSLPKPHSTIKIFSIFGSASVVIILFSLVPKRADRLENTFESSVEITKPFATQSTYEIRNSIRMDGVVIFLELKCKKLEVRIVNMRMCFRNQKE